MWGIIQKKDTHTLDFDVALWLLYNDLTFATVLTKKNSSVNYSLSGLLPLTGEQEDLFFCLCPQTGSLQGCSGQRYNGKEELKIS
jgi:hypothetical protein